MRNEIDQDAVKQVDVIRPEIFRALQEQLGDPAGCLGTALRIAMFDEFIEPGDQRRGKCHQTHSNPSKLQAIGEFSGNLGGLGEGRVRFEPSPNGGKIIRAGFAGLAG
jgi:hypothetical protein